MIFVDTSFWVAAGMAADTHHAAATTLFRAHAHEPLVTSNHVRGETWTFLRRRSGHPSAVDFLDRLDRSPRVEVATVEPALEAEALRWLRRHDEREYSFVDATSIVLAVELGIRRFLAFDEDFTAAGFVQLQP